jgi:hypothetical protein
MKNSEAARDLQLVDKILDSFFRDLALRMALHCVRNTVIEDYHAAGKLTDPEMAALNKEVVNKLYAFLMIVFHPDYEAIRKNALSRLYPPQWDEPKFDEFFSMFLKAIKNYPPWNRGPCP